jgi:hypothetical protein
MMRKLLPLTALTLGLTGGVALADHGRGGDHGDHRVQVEHRAAPGGHVYNNRGPVVRDHREYYGGGRVVVRNEPHYYGGGRSYYGGGRSYYGGGRNYYGGHSYARPIYVSRPVIRERYYNYYRRPALIVENFNPLPGYYWVRGEWTWDGAEWIWQPGHYEPVGGYVGVGYDGGY